MKHVLFAAALYATSAAALAADVGVSVTIGEPGFYGRIDIGDFPQPRVIYPQPVMIQRVPMERPPVYLRVPPGHAKHWGKHCRKYNACGERVYFVRDDWYNGEYVPRYRERESEHRGEYRGERRDDDRGGRQGHGKGRSRDD